MHEFADCLKNYMDMNHISCRNAAILCGVERTSLTKYMNGQRKPRNIDGVLKIAKGLSMSSEDTKLLCEAYEHDSNRIPKDIGYAIVADTLKNTYQEKSVVQYKDVSIACNEIYNLNSKDEILTCLNQMSKQASVIKALININQLEVMQTLLSNCKENKNCRIEQIIEPVIPSEDSADVFVSFQNIYPLLQRCSDYHVYYRYNWGKKKTDGADSKINYVITDKGVLLFHSKMNYGICYTEPHYCNYYKKKYSTLLEKCNVFAETFQLEWKISHHDVSTYYENNGMKKQFIYKKENNTIVICDNNQELHWIFISEEHIIKQIRKFMEEN